MMARDLRVFLDELERRKLLRRIDCEVDPRLEAPEIAARVVREDGPALLFTRPRGARFPLLMNLFGSAERIRLALGREPAAVGEELVGFAGALMESGVSGAAREWRTSLRIAGARSVVVSSTPMRPTVGEPDLGLFPVTTSWPGDGGPFFTFPLVITAAPDGRRQNVGIYRMQVFDGQTTGMHWQIEKGGRFHFGARASTTKSMDVAVAVGADPALLLSAVLPLPEGIDEMAFAGFLRGSPTRVLAGGVRAPADAECVLYGEVSLDERRTEGPFGDHYGHYSGQAPFPVFRVKRIIARENPIFHATVVGKPPMEDWHLGVMTVELMKPLVRLLHPEIHDLWAYPEAGFHNLQAVAVRERYGREALKSAFFLLGTGQTSLAKCVVVVDPCVDIRSFDDVLAAIGRCFDPAEDFFLLAPTSTDTLDFAGPSLEKGSKAILFATTERGEPPQGAPAPGEVTAQFPGITSCAVHGGALLVLTCAGDAREILAKLLPSPVLGGVKLVAAVSDDVDTGDSMSVLWGIFTRFDPARDILAERIEVRGIRAVLHGRLGIDATLKAGYPVALEMDEAVRRTVDRRWKEYFPS